MTGLTDSGPLTFGELQQKQISWARQNFGEPTVERSIYGIAEEFGELCHAQLKGEQGIRTNEDHVADAKDAVGDLVIFVAQYCSVRGFDFQDCVEKAWAIVRQRDYKKNPGGPKP